MLAFIAGMARELANSEIFSGCFVFVFQNWGWKQHQVAPLSATKNGHIQGPLFENWDTFFQIRDTFSNFVKSAGETSFLFSLFFFFFLLTVNAVVYCLLFLARLYCFQQSFSFSLHFLIFFIYIFSIKPGDLHPGTNAVRIKCRL